MESSAYLTEVLSEPEVHGIDPANMVVLHAVVGSEFNDTLRDSERFILPLLRDRGVRLVQLSRRGPAESDGIEILNDTRRPKAMHSKGPWTLAQHNAVNGITPQLSDRRCSLQFKGFVLDRFILTAFPDREYRHAIGYNRDETGRADKDDVYATQTRKPFHPLIDWDWSRTRCLARLHKAFRVTWKKSACSFCPFAGSQASLPDLKDRMRLFPNRAVEALLTEFRALFFNPRSRMFGRHSLYDRLVEDDNLVALARFEQQLDRSQWSVYEVRRLFFPRAANPNKKGPGWRSTRARFTGTRHEALAWIRDNIGAPDETGRVWIRRQATDGPYPRTEHFIGATLAGTADKERRSFAKHWAAFTGETLFDLP
ncbi:hypothetical protein [Amycolatopsis sp. MJM2582]|uniref:hypothetical protein n=1 Tax=Amycolatopsis sp. MJM2582 TaxID=1427749 RepID=UPI00068BC05E|nr:hypothetical protein [Amycolatopsis sp. MJM2582]